MPDVLRRVHNEADRLRPPVASGRRADTAWESYRAPYDASTGAVAPVMVRRDVHRLPRPLAEPVRRRARGRPALPAGAVSPRLRGEPAPADGEHRSASRAGEPAGADALSRQAHPRRHRRRTCPAPSRRNRDRRLDGGPGPRPIGRSRGGGARPRHPVRSARAAEHPHRWAGRGPLRQCRHPAADAPRRRPRPRAIRGQRPAGSARTRPPAGDRALQPAVPALRAGAGPHHARRLRDRSGRLRSLADPAARRFPRAGLPQRTLLQPAGLSPRLDPHSRAAADRLSALSRGQRGIGQGGQALRPQRLYRRTLPDRGRQAPGRQPLPRHPPGRLGRPLRGLRHARILRGLCHHRLAHGGGRLLYRRPRLPRRFVPAPAQPDRGPAARLLADLLAGAVSRRPVLVLRGGATDPLAGAARAVSRSRSPRASSSRRSGSAIPAPKPGRSGP